MKFLKIFSFCLILAIVGKIQCHRCTNITGKINSYWKTNISEQFGLCDKLKIMQAADNLYDVSTLEIDMKNNKNAHACLATFKLDANCNVITFKKLICFGVKNYDQAPDQFLAVSINWNELVTAKNAFCLVENDWDKVLGKYGVQKSAHAQWAVYMVPDETACDVTKKIDNYWKMNLSEHFGLCDKIFEIKEKSNNLYEVSTLEIEAKNNKSAQLCFAVLETDFKCNVKTLKNLTCTGVKLRKQGKHEMFLSLDWNELVTKHYNTSCIVENVAIHNESNIWEKVLGVNDAVNKSVNALWEMDMELQEPDQNSRTGLLQSNKTVEIGPNFGSIEFATYYDPLLWNKVLHFVRRSNNATYF